MPSLIAHLGLNDREFNSKLAKARSGIGKFQRQLGSIGLGLGAAGVLGFFNKVIQTGSQLSDTATQMNINVEALQALNFAAQEAGVGQDILERGLRNVQLRAQEAADGNARYSDAFARLGINVEEFIALPTERKLETVAKAMAEAEDQQAAYRDSATILGERAGPALNEVLQRLATDGFDAVKKSAEDANQIIREETISDLDAAADTMEEFKNATTVAGARVIEIFQTLAEVVGTVAAGIAELDFTTAADNLFRIFDKDRAEAADRAEAKLAATRARIKEETEKAAKATRELARKIQDLDAGPIARLAAETRTVSLNIADGVTNAADLAEINEEIERIQREIARHQTDQLATSEQLTNKTGEQAAAEGDVTAEKREQTQQTQAQKAAQAELANLQARRAAIVELLRGHQEAISAAAAGETETTGELAELQEALRTVDAEILDLTQQTADVKEDIADTTEETLSAERRITDEQRQQLNNLRAQARALRDREPNLSNNEIAARVTAGRGGGAGQQSATGLAALAQLGEGGFFGDGVTTLANGVTIIRPTRPEPDPISYADRLADAFVNTFEERQAIREADAQRALLEQQYAAAQSRLDFLESDAFREKASRQGISEQDIRRQIDITQQFLNKEVFAGQNFTLGDVVDKLEEVKSEIELL